VSSPAPDPVWRLDGILLELLSELSEGLGLTVERVQAGAYLVTLPGQARAATYVWLIAGEQAVAVEAFVMHVVPGGCDDPAALHRYLLRRNLGLRTVHLSLDDVGDVFLVGSLPHEAVTAAGIDRVLGELASLLEDTTATLLGLAYGDRLAGDPALRAKATVDGAGRRPAGTAAGSPQRDARR